MTFNDPLSPIRLQLMWDRLIAVVEEQAQTLIRTGFSTSTREAGDLSAGVFDRDGNMLAQAVTGTPGHVNSMARSVRHFIAKFPVAEMAEGGNQMGLGPVLGIGDLHGFPGPGGGIAKITAKQMGEGAIGIERPAKRIVRAQANGDFKLLDGLIEAPFIGQ